MKFSISDAVEMRVEASAILGKVWLSQVVVYDNDIRLRSAFGFGFALKDVSLALMNLVVYR